MPIYVHAIQRQNYGGIQLEYSKSLTYLTGQKRKRGKNSNTLTELGTILDMLKITISFKVPA